MPFIVKIGDMTADGGIISGPGWPNITLNGIPLARPGTGTGAEGLKLADKITPHPCCGSPGCQVHCVSQVLAQRLIGRITVNGLPMVVMGDVPTCGPLGVISKQTIPTTAFAGP